MGRQADSEKGKEERVSQNVLTSGLEMTEVVKKEVAKPWIKSIEDQTPDEELMVEPSSLQFRREEYWTYQQRILSLTNLASRPVGFRILIRKSNKFPMRGDIVVNKKSGRIESGGVAEVRVFLRPRHLWKGPKRKWKQHKQKLLVQHKYLIANGGKELGVVESFDRKGVMSLEVKVPLFLPRPVDFPRTATSSVTLTPNSSVSTSTPSSQPPSSQPPSSLPTSDTSSPLPPPQPTLDPSPSLPSTETPPSSSTPSSQPQPALSPPPPSSNTPPPLSPSDPPPLSSASTSSTQPPSTFSTCHLPPPAASLGPSPPPTLSEPTPPSSERSLPALDPSPTLPRADPPLAYSSVDPSGIPVSPSVSLCNPDATPIMSSSDPSICLPVPDTTPPFSNSDISSTYADPLSSPSNPDPSPRLSLSPPYPLSASSSLPSLPESPFFPQPDPSSPLSTPESSPSHPYPEPSSTSVDAFPPLPVADSTQDHSSETPSKPDATLSNSNTSIGFINPSSSDPSHHIP